MALSSRSPFGHALYVSDTAAGSILKIEDDGSITPVISGLTNPGSIQFSPEGYMMVVYDGKYLLRVDGEAGTEEQQTENFDGMPPANKSDIEGAGSSG